MHVGGLARRASVAVEGLPLRQGVPTRVGVAAGVARLFRLLLTLRRKQALSVGIIWVLGVAVELVAEGQLRVGPPAETAFRLWQALVVGHLDTVGSRDDPGGLFGGNSVPSRSRRVTRVHLGCVVGRECA